MATCNFRFLGCLSTNPFSADAELHISNLFVLEPDGPFLFQSMKRKQKSRQNEASAGRFDGLRTASFQQVITKKTPVLFDVIREMVPLGISPKYHRFLVAWGNPQSMLVFWRLGKIPKARPVFGGPFGKSPKLAGAFFLLLGNPQSPPGLPRSFWEIPKAPPEHFSCRGEIPKARPAFGEPLGKSPRRFLGCILLGRK